MITFRELHLVIFPTDVSITVDEHSAIEYVLFDPLGKTEDEATIQFPSEVLESTDDGIVDGNRNLIDLFNDRLRAL